MLGREYFFIWWLNIYSSYGFFLFKGTQHALLLIVVRKVTTLIQRVSGGSRTTSITSRSTGSKDTLLQCHVFISKYLLPNRNFLLLLISRCCYHRTGTFPKTSHCHQYMRCHHSSHLTGSMKMLLLMRQMTTDLFTSVPKAVGKHF